MSDLAPDRVTVLDTQAVVLMLNKKTGSARRVINQALKLAPENPLIKFHSAQIANAEGNKEEAVKILKEIVSSDFNFSEKKQAQELLNALDG